MSHGLLTQVFIDGDRGFSDVFSGPTRGLLANKGERNAQGKNDYETKNGGSRDGYPQYGGSGAHCVGK